MPSPNNAVPIGSPIANTEPKARIRMMTAAMMPRISLSGSSNSPKMSPPYSTVSPWIAGCSSPNSSIVLPRSVTSWKSRSVTSSWAKAIVPSWLICCGLSYGLVTCTPSCSTAKAMRAWSLSCTCGSSTPWSAWITICDEKPARSGLLASISSWTSFDSLSGSTKSVR